LNARPPAVTGGGEAGRTGAWRSDRTDMPVRYKIPQSVLVVIHTPGLEVLLLERADAAPGFWQSVTGSKDDEHESFWATAVREVFEETGIDALAPGHALRDWHLENVYDIYPEWRHRYAPGVERNTEHLFGLCVPRSVPVRLNPREHRNLVWLPYMEAAERCFSPSNAEAILWLPRFAGMGPDVARR
jgi:dATP pyrophosphohydrolase